MACFEDEERPWHSLDKQEFEHRGTRWLLRRNPGYWGDPDPRVLVLGFSKGGDQQGTVILLGADEKYVRACCRRLGGKALGPADEPPYTYAAHGRVYAHVPHPSGQAAGFRNVFNGVRPPIPAEASILLCRRQVLSAIEGMSMIFGAKANQR